MTKYYRDGEAYFPQSEARMGNVLDKLPPGNYVIKRSMAGLFFAKYDVDFAVQGKVYGNASERADRIINTFLDRRGSTGVLLSGEKGSGKTMLGKLICQKLSSREVPTIFVTEPWSGDQFMELIGSIDQPAVIFFDEFEKVYDGDTDEIHGNHNQTGILTLLDGIFTTQKLFILTCNDKYKIDDHMINRPGRIFYAFDFTGLDEDFVREYAADNLKNSVHLDGVVRVSSLFRHFNFDMLKALIEEVNRYDEKPAESLVYLNINPESDLSNYKATIYPIGMTEPLQKSHPAKTKSPLAMKGEELHFHTYELKGRNKIQVAPGISVMSDDDENEYTVFTFSASDIKLVTGDRFELVNKAGDRLVLTKEEYSFDWRAL